MVDEPSQKRSGRRSNSAARVATQLRVQSALIRAQAAMLADSSALLERVSQAARIGIWECDLPHERLRWTEGVYDLFDLPRASPIDRRATLELYERSSREALEETRRKAIAEGEGFTLDAEIATPAGRRRWIRVTATVERVAGTPVRLFGMKQDVTEEKLLLARTRQVAETDPMTGLASRIRFEARLRESVGALLLVDLDGFKLVNDTYGHAAGDACLKVTAMRLAQLCSEADLVARIGGDEFAIIVSEGSDNAADDASIAALATRIVDALRAPIRHGGLSLCVGASVGVALPDAATAEHLFACADAALYAAKAGGRNTFRWFHPGHQLRAHG